MTLGENLKGLRLMNRWTLREVADRAGISHSALSQIESGAIVQPTPLTLRMLAEVYEVPCEHLMVAAGYLDPSKEPAKGSVFRGEERLTPEQRQAVQQIIDLLTDER